MKKPLVKRVIGLAGDRVQINSDGKVFVNGEQIDEPYVNIDSLTFIYQPLDVLVPEGKLFVMGDHRNRSTDSREIGCIDENTVLGRVLLRFYPFDRFGPVD